MKNYDKERELNVWCKCILDYTKERVENDSVATRWIFDRVTHDEWVLSLFPKHLASVEAYQQFYQLTGKDIRNYDWNSTIKTKNGEVIIVHQLFVDEHLTTAHDFKYEIISLYKKGELTIEKIKELISQQRLCWITKEENKNLTKNGFGIHRVDPLKAYELSGIKIYDVEKENLQIMKPTFSRSESKILPNLSSPIDIFNKLKNYFSNNLFDGKKFIFNFYENEAYAWIYKHGPFMINVRFKQEALKDISLFISGLKAKEYFSKLLLRKDMIEKKLGYKLVWDKNEKKQASRIGRFFKDACLSSNFEIENQHKCFEFNLEDSRAIEKVAFELVKFYNVFTPIIQEIT